MEKKRREKRIYLSPPHMSEEGFEFEFVREAFESNWIAPIGPQVDAFEREFTDYLGTPYAAALSSGTAGLHLALMMTGIEAGDEVLCSSFTFAASANAITYLKAKPVFIDSEYRTWNMDPNLLEDRLKSGSRKGKTPKAVIVVDICGQCADYDPIAEICDKYGVKIIEDAAEALGAEYKDKKAGNFGLINVFSFNGNKIITTSGGGMLTSENKEYVDKAHYLSQQARDPAPYYRHSEIGYNYRMSNILAAIGRGQLRVLDERIEKTRHIFRLYKKMLSELPGLQFMPEPEGFFSTHWLSCILVNQDEFGKSAEDIRLHLEKYNIESRNLWYPMHLQPVFKGVESVGGDVSKNLFEKGLSLPSSTLMDDADIEFVSDLIHDLHKERN